MAVPRYSDSDTKSHQMHQNVLSHIQERWNLAAATWNIKELAQIYTSDAVFFGLLPKLYVGRAEIEEYFASYKLILERVTLELVDQRMRPLGPHAFSAQGYGRIVNHYRDGSTIPNTVRSSFVFVEMHDGWEISLHHFSNLIPP